MPTPNLVPARGAHFAEVSPQLIAFFDALRNPAITDQALLALLPGDSADFYKHDPRTGLIALHYAVYEGRAQILREMLVRLRINIPDNRQYQEAISTFSQSRNGETPEEYYQAREEYFNADAFALCFNGNRYDLAEIFIQNAYSSNYMKGYLRNMLVNYMHHVISLCFACREYTSAAKFQFKLNNFNNLGTAIAFLIGHLPDYEEDEHMPGIHLWLRPMSDRYPYHDYPNAVPASFISWRGHLQDLRNDVTRAKEAELIARYADRPFTKQDLLEAAGEFLTYSIAEYESVLREPEAAYVHQTRRPENLPFLKRTLEIHRALFHKVQLSQAMSDAHFPEAIQACIQGWRAGNENARLTEAQVLAINEMMNLAEQSKNYHVAFILSRVINSEMLRDLPERSVIARAAIVWAPQPGGMPQAQAAALGGAAAGHAAGAGMPAHP